MGSNPRSGAICSRDALSVLEIPLDKELTANCLVETRTKLEELILVAMVKYGMIRVPLPLIGCSRSFDHSLLVKLKMFS